MLKKIINSTDRLISTARIPTSYRNYSFGTSNVDKSELEHFAQLASLWWNEKSPVKILHRMNTLRVPFIRDVITHIRSNSDRVNIPNSLEHVKLLDVGCGGGLLSEPLAKLGIQVVGVDASEDLIKVAKYHASTNQSLSNLSYVFTTIEEISKSHNNQFDVVVASEVVEHIPDVENFVSECVKSVKPGGSLVFTTINKTISARLYVIFLLERFEIIPRGTHHYEKLVRPALLQNILEKNSCRVLQIKGMWYNMITTSWSFTGNTSMFYILHAVKI